MIHCGNACMDSSMFRLCNLQTISSIIKLHTIQKKPQLYLSKNSKLFENSVLVGVLNPDWSALSIGISAC